MDKKYKLSLLTSENCNMRCSYCYQHKLQESRNLSIEKFESLIPSILKDPNFKNHIQFFGGEPTLNKPLIKHIINKYPDIALTIITNGWWIDKDPEIIDLLKHMRGISVSIEGTEHAYKTIRGMSNLKDKINKFITHFNKITFNISINGLLAKDVQEFCDIVKLILESDNYIHLYSLKSEYDYFESNDHWFKFISEVQSIYPDLYLELIGCRVLNDDLENLYRYQFEPWDNKPNMCSFDNMITINHNGDILPCSRIPDIKVDSDKYKDNLSVVLDTFIDNLSDGSNYRCDKCELRNYTVCQIRCPALHDELIKTNPEKLDQLCNRELIKHKLRNQFWEDNPNLKKEIEDEIKNSSK